MIITVMQRIEMGGKAIEKMASIELDPQTSKAALEESLNVKAFTHALFAKLDAAEVKMVTTNDEPTNIIRPPGR